MAIIGLHFGAFHFVVHLNAMWHPIDVDNAVDDIEFDSNHVNPGCMVVHCPNQADFLAMYLRFYVLSRTKHHFN